MKSIYLEKSEALISGLNYDRHFMISKPDGTFITAREYPQLLALTVTINDKGILISLNKQQNIHANFADFSMNDEQTEVWGNRFTSHIASINVNRFLSDFLGRDVQLRWVGKQFTRRVNRYPNTPLGFADGYPYLLINKASFEYLQHQCPEQLDIKQFRGNIIIDNALPFAEDGWKTIKIGKVIFDLIKPCSRCIMTTVKPSTTQYLVDNQPLKTLRYFRQDEQGEIDFGINMVARNTGIIAINDRVEILAYQTAKKYIKSAPPKKENHQAKACLINTDSKTINGNTQQPILDQLEQHGIQIPYYCRTGVCGRCQILLEEGQVQPMTQSAIKQNNYILACSCIPQTDIKIKLKNEE